jgi:two-component system, OmpR family, response regulator MprA
MALRVLIADDDPRIVGMLRRGLHYAGFEVLEATDGEQALRVALTAEPDLVVLDIAMPKLDGYEVCERLRASSRVPILMLTARGEVPDRVSGLRSGADDYLVKPFAFQELTARLEALARRAGLMAGEVLRFADVELDTATARVTRRGEPVDLAPRERELLELLMRHPQQVLETTTVWERVWGDDRSGESNAMNVAFSGLRRKLGAPTIIETVRGIGYRLRDPSQ